MSAPTAGVAAEPKPKPEDSKLSFAEQKKRAKAEKQARRAAQKDPSEPSAGPVANGNTQQKQQQQAGQKPKGEQGQQQQLGKQGKGLQDGEAKKAGAQQNQQQGQQQGQQQSQTQSLPLRGKPTQQKASKQVELFSHLYAQPRRHTIEGASKDVHPAVLALGLQMSSYEICGSSARCVAMLLAFKEAIQAYTVPLGTSMPRHLNTHYLSPQIDYLKTCRPISESMGNAIRWLKKLIVEIDPSTPEHAAKKDLCEKIDGFIHERITITDQAIAGSASQQITDGSVVLTYAKSSIVERTILEAHGRGTEFTVIVVDSRPLFEGKALATSLMHAGLNVEYLPYSAIAHAVKQASIVLLGAHSMLSNGRLQSRIGTAALAMHASTSDVPVIVLCESVKFSGKVALDSILLNEVAPSEELFLRPRKTTAIVGANAGEQGEDAANQVKTLANWKEIPNLQILNLMYDVTPAEYIRMVICEYGSLPPSSVPVVHRLANEAM